MAVCEQPFGDRFRDGALPRSGEPVQPVDGGSVKVPCPMFDTAKNGLTGSFETAFALAVSVPSPTRTAEVIEDRLFGYKRIMSDTRPPDQTVF